MFYNGNSVKVGTIANAIKVFGNPAYAYSDDLIYNSPINITGSSEQKGTYGNAIVEYKGKECPLTYEKGKTIEKNWDMYRTKGGQIARKRNEAGILLGDVTTYRIWMSPYERSSSTLSKEDSLNIKIPALNGYIKINGKLIHQSITKKNLSNRCNQCYMAESWLVCWGIRC